MKKKITVLTIFIIAALSSNFSAQAQPSFDTLSVGNIKQVVSYSGDKNNPAILFLHGGPGSSRMKQAEAFSNILQKHFLVVQWDQRDAGRTLALNKSPVPLTVNLMEEDTYELIKLLLKKFNQKKLYLAGESFGTVLGFKMSEKHPKLLNAYLAFSPVINQAKSEQILLDTLKSEANEKGDTTAQKELATVKIPYGNYEQLGYAKKWMLEHDGISLAGDNLPAFNKFIKDWSDTWLPAWNEAIGHNLFTELPKINCPVYFFLGKKDLQTNASIAKAYFEILKAPKKQIYVFDNAGHSVLTEEAERVQQLIVKEVLKKD